MTSLQENSVLLNHFQSTAWMDTVEASLGQHAELHVENLANPSVKALLLASLFKRENKPIIVINPDPQTALKYHFELRQYLNEDHVCLYPAEEFSPYDLSVFPVPSLRAQYHTLKQLVSGEPAIYLLSPKNLLLRHLSLTELDQYATQLKAGQVISPEELTEQCLAMGYLRTSLIKDPGEFSSRGDIFDLYPVNGEPVRIEFFGDTIEGIRVIDVENQRSVQQAKSVLAIPRAGIILNKEHREKLPALLDKHLQKQKALLSDIEYEGLATTITNQLQALDQQFLPDGIDYYGPLVQTPHETAYKTVMDYLPAKALVVVDDWQVLANNMGGLSDRLATQYKEGLQKGRLLDIGFQYHLSDSEALAALKAKSEHRLFLDTLPVMSGEVSHSGSIPVVSMDIHAPEQYKAHLQQACEQFQKLRRGGYRIFITTDHPQRVLDACKEWDVPAQYLADTSGNAGWELATLDVLISKNGPITGFILPDQQIAHYTDAELYGRKMKKRLFEAHERSKREEMDIINSINDLREGDFVVHAIHGVGQFGNLTRIEMDGEVREYLTIKYSGNDKLHVPIDQVNLLSRYRGTGEVAPRLSKMGGVEWSKVTSKVKKSIQKVAKELQELYAKRAKVKGHIFEPDTPWQVEMEESFPYTETPDQWQAIMDVKSDMESDRPMDRLICGDVGFGKTEVAIRAAFKAVLSGKQVAFLVPTTILAQQHFNTLTERFQPYPVRMGLLSRFRSPKEQKEVLARLAIGECDIVVGTHRLLQKDVVFKDLGLVIIDEEHRFGVSHKEKMKQLRTEVDVLTLSATPIPRTLHMALSGIREMSLINTPPVNRAPVKTFVGPYNPAQIRMAILQEVDRGGQVYFLHNRVQTIYDMAARLKELIPEVRIAVGHGQLTEHELENVMLDFAQHQYDVLVCTTIIESGLDIPNSNTIVIDRSDRFGLAQLYQIRGRVGRSETQAYAFLYYDPERQLTQDAKDRLRAIREFTTLGSGYQIALRDMEIRGVGTILGADQHGHMVAVGYDLYCQMLEESIQELQGKDVSKKDHAIIDLNVTAYIPDEWAGDRDVKLSEYKRLAGMESLLQLDIIRAEWQDRFGDVPPETEQLLSLARLRIMATGLNIPMVRMDDEYLRISVPYTLQEWMFLQRKLPQEFGGRARWVPGVTSKQGSTPTLLVKASAMTGEDQVEFLTEFFKNLEKTVNVALAEMKS